MKTTSRLLILACLLFSPLFQESLWARFAYNNADIYLIDQIGIEAPTVTLGEIATVDSEDAPLKKQLLDIEVDQAPRIGTSRVVSSYRVKQILKEHNIENVKVHGLQSTVTTLERDVNKEELISLIETWVKDNVSQNTSVEIEYIRLPLYWKVPKSDSVQLIVYTHTSRFGNLMNLTLRAVHGEEILASERARIKLSLFRDTAVIVRPLSKGDILTAEHIEIRKADVTNTTGMEVQEIQNFIGMVSKRKLPVGTIPTVDDFESPVLIQRGTKNRILVVNKNISLSIAGAEALQNGKKGDVILFSNPMNEQEPLRARVERQGLAIIQLR